MGQSEEVAHQVRANPDLVVVLLQGALGDDPLVRMRAADALEKATRDRPEALRRHTRTILAALPTVEQQEVRWHWAQLVPRLQMTEAQRAAAVAVLERWLRDDSRLVRVHALQALADLATLDPSLRDSVASHVRHATRSGPPSLRARARKLAKLLKDSP